MINYKIKRVKAREIKSMTCDVCGRTDDNDFDIQEYHHIDFIGGYGSVFGDEVRIRCDICQECLLKMIGPHCYYETEDGLMRFIAPER